MKIDNIQPKAKSHNHKQNSKKNAKELINKKPIDNMTLNELKQLVKEIVLFLNIK